MRFSLSSRSSGDTFRCTGSHTDQLRQAFWVGLGLSLFLPNQTILYSPFGFRGRI